MNQSGKRKEKKKKIVRGRQREGGEARPGGSRDAETES